MLRTHENIAAARSVAKTAAERVAGTVAGGVLGLAVRATAEYVDTAYEFLLYGTAAGLVGAFAAWLSFKLPQGAYAAKLLVITFLLVFAGADSVVRRPRGRARRGHCVRRCVTVRASVWASEREVDPSSRCPPAPHQVHTAHRLALPPACL